MRGKMIKEGQVWKNKKFKNKCVVTDTYDDDEWEVFCTIIYEHGVVDSWISEDKMNDDFTLLAEYSTWQEAVNSPEFNGDKNS